MFDGDGSETMELQAKQIAENATRYNGSAPCPTCGVMMNPVRAAVQNKGHCLSCLTQKRATLVSRGML
jgi:hypothetical protein